MTNLTNNGWLIKMPLKDFEAQYLIAQEFEKEHKTQWGLYCDTDGVRVMSLRFYHELFHGQQRGFWATAYKNAPEYVIRYVYNCYINWLAENWLIENE